MFRTLFVIFRHLSLKRRWQLSVVLALMLCGAVAEIFTLGAVVPFLGFLINPEAISGLSKIYMPINAIAWYLGTTLPYAASLVFALLAVCAAVLRLVLLRVSFRFVYAVGADFGETIYALTLKQPYLYHVERNSSQTIAAVEKVTVLVVGVMVPLMNMLIAALMVTALLAAMLWINPLVALGAGGLFGALYASISVWAKRRLNYNSQISALNATKKMQALQEGLGAIRDVIIDGNQAVYVAKFAQADRAQRTAQASNQVLSVAPKYVVESVGLVMMVLLALYLTQQPGGAASALPLLGALALGAQRMLPHMQNMYSGVSAFRGNRAAAEEVLDLLDLPDTDNATQLLVDTDDSLSRSTQHPLIELCDVCFSYSPSSDRVLKGIQLRVRRGERIGFTGVTGCGKSTLIDLILGLLPPTTGQIRIEGEALATTNLRQWQNRIAHVPQSIFLTDASIAENVALGVPTQNIDESRLRRVMAAAHMTEFVDRLPQGLATRVGERGVQLSGGQRQRIGLARALYKQADVLILDEATSALDGATEGHVMDAIYQLNPNVVVLMIAHRLSTLEKCDVIYEIFSGRLRWSSGRQPSCE